MGNRHGCCADKACNSSTCMELPNGKTCGDCVIFARCKAFFGCKPTNTSCDWFPRKFVERPPLTVGRVNANIQAAIDASRSRQERGLEDASGVSETAHAAQPRGNDAQR